ncbi:MAG: YdcF family protein [Xenococcus sp. MO_188.B8]|nr:YdcF family protein [Xenococcus sp. MO_188.B8]
MSQSDRKDVIVVLGAAVWKGSIPSPSLHRRILHAIELIHCQKASTLILSGGIGKYPPSEAQIMRQISLEQGIHENQIILDEQAQSTLESAINCTRIIQENQWDNVLIVSDHYHIFRAVLLFRLLGIYAEGSSPDKMGIGTSRWQCLYLHVREIIALPWNIIKIGIFRIRKQPVSEI